MNQLNKFALFLTAAAICAGCSLSEPDHRQDCPKMIGVMTTDRIVDVDDLDPNKIEYLNAISDKKCPYIDMICDNKICVYSCKDEGEKRNFKYLDDECYIFKCTDGYWEKTDNPCREMEAECDEDEITYTSNDESKCVKTTCVKGKTKVDNSCEFSCKKKKDKLAGCGECINYDKKCENDTAYECVNGEWKETENCPSGCFEDHCSACKDDDVRCHENAVEKCANQEWVVQENCGFECTDNQCTECASGTDKCENSTISTCIQGYWKPKMDCSGGCADDGLTCATPRIPVAGDNCNVELFQNVCDGNDLYQCGSNGKVIKSYCTDGFECDTLKLEQTCVYNAERSNELCQGKTIRLNVYDPCDNGKFTYVSCEYDVNGKLVANQATVDSLCEFRNGQTYKLTCNDSNEIVLEKCSSCEMTKNKAICINETEEDNHKHNDPCSKAGIRTCDGDILIECNGSKYTSVYLDSNGNPLSCKDHTNGELSCAKQVETHYAGCVLESETCNQDNQGSIIGYMNQCRDDNKLQIFICDKTSTGEYKGFNGYFTSGYCGSDNEFVTCNTSKQLAELQTCSNSCEQQSPELDSYLCQ